MIIIHTKILQGYKRFNSTGSRNKVVCIRCFSMYIFTAEHTSNVKIEGQTIKIEEK